MIVVASHAESKLVYVSFPYWKVDKLISEATDPYQCYQHPTVSLNEPTAEPLAMFLSQSLEKRIGRSANSSENKKSILTCYRTFRFFNPVIDPPCEMISSQFFFTEDIMLPIKSWKISF